MSFMIFRTFKVLVVSVKSSGCHSVCLSVWDKVLILLIYGSYLQIDFK